MRMFVSRHEMLTLELALPPLEQQTTGTQLPMWVALVWQMRQLGSKRARKLAVQADAALPQMALPPAIFQQIQVRLWLILAEIDWLNGDGEAALARLEQILQQNVQPNLPPNLPPHHAIEQTPDDAENCMDAAILAGAIALDRGEIPTAMQFWCSAIALAQAIGDIHRLHMVQLMQAQHEITSGQAGAQERWSLLFHAGMLPDLPPVVSAAVQDFLFTCASLAENTEHAIELGIAAYQALLNSGQILRTIAVTANLCKEFGKLQEYQSALEWGQRGLELARTAQWPASISLCLVQLGENLRCLTQYDEAELALNEALTLLGGLNADNNPSRNKLTLLACLAQLAQLAQARGNDQQALSYFHQLALHEHPLHEFKNQTRCVQALSHIRLGQGALALALAREVLQEARAQNNIAYQVASLSLLAQVYRHFSSLPLPEACADPELYFLQQAYALVAQDAIAMPVLDALAQAYVERGDTRNAYRFTSERNQKQNTLHRQEAKLRALAMQARFKTERASEEDEHHQQLAQAQAQRAQVLQETSATLSQLGLAGQEITAHLSARDVFVTLQRHVDSLLDPSSFAVYLCQPDGQHLLRTYGVEGTKTLPQIMIDLANPGNHAARCAREQREILLDTLTPDSTVVQPSTDAAPVQTALFAPLKSRERLLGVMVLESAKHFASDERALLIFRTLCAYAAIAFDNADACWRLQEAQEQLVAKEKLAALGALVAGVAHELNTPLGNSLMMASALDDSVKRFSQGMQDSPLRRDNLLAFLEETREAASLIMYGLTSATELVDSFKQVAVDRTSAQCRVFYLQKTMQEMIATMMTQIRHSGHSIEVEIDPAIRMSSYPGPLGQVIANFINNAMLHAFEEGSSGHMRLTGQKLPSGRVKIVFEDNGAGIPEQNMVHIFEPFFTTKMGQGGSGLGLSICYNIITSILNGQIQVESQTGKGTHFILDLPLVVDEA
jgi:signal transduction histidine kinase